MQIKPGIPAGGMPLDVVTTLRPRELPMMVAAERPGEDITDEQAEAIAREFEAMVVTNMMEHMFRDINSDAFFGGGHAERVWRSFMLEEYGKLIAAGQGIGISDSVKSVIASYRKVSGQ